MKHFLLRLTIVIFGLPLIQFGVSAAAYASVLNTTTATLDWSTFEMSTTGDLVLHGGAYSTEFYANGEGTSTADWSTPTTFDSSTTRYTWAGYADENTLSVSRHGLYEQSPTEDTIGKITGDRRIWLGTTGSGYLTVSVDYTLLGDTSNSYNSSHQNHSWVKAISGNRVLYIDGGQANHDRAGTMSFDYWVDDSSFKGISFQVKAVPIPATAWLFGSALAGLLVAKRKR